mmetsp:Transcript_108254/g.337359  ORF Transcript_108254/g.337359 Transcript_108254/m.337359 type:complete len:268 (+) Transcript_108254:962-1765(+)
MTLSDATAVRIEIIVQEQKAMKSTKKRHHTPFIWITGFAMTNQLSIVMIWKSEKKEVCTSEKNTATSSASSPSTRPRIRVIPMETQRLKPKSTIITKKNGPSIVFIASRNAVNLLNIFNTRRSRSNLNNLRKRRTPEPPAICAWPASLCMTCTTSGASHRSAAPRSTMSMSRTFHHFSFLLVKNSSTPFFQTRSANSTRKMQRKTLSRTGHMGHSGWSVSPATAMVFKAMTPPMKAWKTCSSTRYLEDELLSPPTDKAPSCPRASLS